jgi:acyl-CoA reductase-like NAD-dependent aldehyde dehydrogenase
MVRTELPWLICQRSSIQSGDWFQLYFSNRLGGARIYLEEIFGPVLCLVRVPDLDNAIALLNAHEFGNGVSCYTNNGKTAQEFAHRIKIGMVGINVPMAWHSFGGWKDSLFGGYHAYGDEGVRLYTRYKSIMQRWYAPPRAPTAFGSQPIQ